jgi:DNA-binding HxlR family transcriptional regulator
MSVAVDRLADRGTDVITIQTPPVALARIGLGLLRPELNRAILGALAVRPMGVSDLCAQLMLESETTLREQLERLAAAGAIAKQKTGRTSAGEFRLTGSGDDLVAVIALTGVWLTERPGGPLSPEGAAAWRAFAALADGWEIALLQHLLLRPSSRAELLGTIPLNREKLKRMLRRLRGAGLLGPLDRDDRTPRYALTVWGRRAIAILISIAYWERVHPQCTAGPIAASDGAVALLASLPLIRPPADTTGVCVFTVEGEPDAPSPRSSAVWIRLGNADVTACRSGTPSLRPDAWVHGRVGAWLEAVIKARPTALHLGGDSALAESALRSLHDELFQSHSL